MLRRSMIMLLVAAMLSSVASAVTVDELVAKYDKARGGAEKVKAVKTMRLIGSIEMQGIKAPVTIMIKRPHMIRTEFTLQGQTARQGYDGTTGWIVMPFAGKTDPEKMSAEDSKDFEAQSDFDGPLVDYKAKGNKIELVGTDTIDSLPVYQLKVTLKSGGVRNIYLDAERFLEVKETSLRKAQGTEVQLDAYFGDFKSVDGLMIPYSIESRIKGQVVSKVVLTKVELNTNIPDSLFKMPAKTTGSGADSTGRIPATAPPETEHKPDSTKK